MQLAGFQRTRHSVRFLIIGQKALSEATVPTKGREMLAELTKTDSLAAQRGSPGPIGNALFKLTQSRVASGWTNRCAPTEAS